MISEAELEGALQQWGKEYGGRRYEDLGYSATSILQRLREMGGYIPRAQGFRPHVEIGTRADTVEGIVREMEGSEDRRHHERAAVLRVFYCTGFDRLRRLNRLRRLGYGMSETKFNRRMESGRAYVSARLEEIHRKK